MNKITKTKRIYKAINVLTIISFFITFVLLFLDFKTFDADEIESGVSPLIIFVSFFF